MRSKPPRTVRWYLRVSDGDFETTNLDFVDSAADALNGVYLCCGEMYVNAEGQYVQARSDAALAALVLPYLQRGLDTWLVLGAAYQAINSGRAMAAIPDIAVSHPAPLQRALQRSAAHAHVCGGRAGGRGSAVPGRCHG